jgi:hypothetical protein
MNSVPAPLSIAADTALKRVLRLRRFSGLVCTYPGLIAVGVGKLCIGPRLVAP